jgi:hypothetical protein
MFLSGVRLVQWARCSARSSQWLTSLGVKWRIAQSVMRRLMCAHAGARMCGGRSSRRRSRRWVTSGPAGMTCAPKRKVTRSKRRSPRPAGPANRRLDAEVQSYADHEHRNLVAAEADLRAEAATERWFDQCLLKIPFPPLVAATARVLARANQRRAELTVRQAGSPSLAALQSFTRRHESADAAVEAQVKAIRRALGCLLQ